MEKFVIGVLGGMGTYATINLFNQYAEVFKAEKEWDRPRIIIDNRCTMPSRVKAFLYNENREELVNQMSQSMKYLSDAGATRIILACNTSHLFLEEIYKKIPEIKNKVLNIIDICVNKIKDDNIKEVYLLGSEGTIDSKIYQNALEKHNIRCIVPTKEEYYLIRECIEAVKQNKYSDDIKIKFLNLINKSNCCILGCSELPILYAKYQESITCKKIYDPFLLGIKELKKEFEND